ncbi:TPA: hypothetical protein ACMY33_001270 [Yersinia enterocolitica]
MTTALESTKVWLITYQYSDRGGNGVGNLYHRNKDESEFIGCEKLKEIEQWIIDAGGVNKIVITGIYRLADEISSPPEEDANGKTNNPI